MIKLSVIVGLLPPAAVVVSGVMWHAAAMGAEVSMPLPAVTAPPQFVAPMDNDQYYTAPGQYMDNKYYYPQAAPAASSGCNTIGDSPSCIGD